MNKVKRIQGKVVDTVVHSHSVTDTKGLCLMLIWKIGVTNDFYDNHTTLCNLVYCRPQGDIHCMQDCNKIYNIGILWFIRYPHLNDIQPHLNSASDLCDHGCRLQQHYFDKSTILN